MVAAAIDALKPTNFYPMIVRNIGLHGKPFNTSQDYPARMDILIRWKNGTHGDPENVFGAIADALFHQDKYLAGSFDWDRKEKGSGKVEVTITLEKNN